jgi:putative toxin-antitoxin system antitoxin component (TIGR02293 family)
MSFMAKAKIIHKSPSRKSKTPSYKRDAKLTRVNPGVVGWLGGAKAVGVSIDSAFDYITVGKAGLTKISIEELARHVGVSRKAMSEDILGISVKTLERKLPEDRFDRKISSHAIEIAKVMQHAFEVFEDEIRTRLWMNTHNKSLSGMNPVELLNTLTGLTMINDVLGRIEEGVYT